MCVSLCLCALHTQYESSSTWNSMMRTSPFHILCSFFFNLHLTRFQECIQLQNYTNPTKICMPKWRFEFWCYTLLCKWKRKRLCVRCATRIHFLKWIGNFLYFVLFYDQFNSQQHLLAVSFACECTHFVFAINLQCSVQSGKWKLNTTTAMRSFVCLLICLFIFALFLSELLLHIARLLKNPAKTHAKIIDS